jgi:hypothetical protein
MGGFYAGFRSCQLGAGRQNGEQPWETSLVPDARVSPGADPRAGGTEGLRRMGRNARVARGDLAVYPDPDSPRSARPAVVVFRSQLAELLLLNGRELVLDPDQESEVLLLELVFGGHDVIGLLQRGSFVNVVGLH